MNDIFDMCGADDVAPTMPLIGDRAPEFVAETTDGTVNFPADYRGKWVILFSHPSDFTSVCTSEFMTFQAMIPEFRELNADVIGLSIGTVSSHLAWLRDIQTDVEFRGWKNMEITFPVIADMKMEIAKKYGMLHAAASDTMAVRAVFVIDPAGIIRTILYYPASLGRNFAEIKRILMGLQMTDAFGYSAPADWVPGDDVLVAAPKTSAGVQERVQNKKSGWNVVTWFMTFTKLPADMLLAKIKSKQPQEKPSKNTKKK